MKIQSLSRSLTVLTLFGAAAMILLGMNPEAWAKGKPGAPGGYETLCEGSGSVTVNGETLTLNHKIRKGTEPGKDPLRNEFSSTLGSSQFVRIAAPEPGCLLTSIVVTIADNSDCFPSDITYNFDCNGNMVSVNSNDNDGGQYKTTDILPSNETIFNGLKDPLGYSSVNFPTEEGDAFLEAVCSFISGEISNGNTDAAVKAGAIGSLAGAMYPQLMRCMGEFADIKTESGDPSSCTPDQIATGTALTLLSAAQEVDLTLTSDGAGTYSVTNNDNNTSATVTLSSDGTCVADGENFQL